MPIRADYEKQAIVVPPAFMSVYLSCQIGDVLATGQHVSGNVSHV